MSMNPLIRLRLCKEERQLAEEPEDNILVHPDKELHYHFVFYNLKEGFEGGVYHGMLELHPNYPFAAPKLFFFTRNGRFQTNTPICASFTNYHQESWSSAWNLRSLLIATLSFMQSEEPSFGCIATSLLQKKEFATRSMKENCRNLIFRRLFLDELKEKGYQFEEQIDMENSEQLPSQLIEPRAEREGHGPLIKKIILISVACGLIGLGMYLKFS